MKQYQATESGYTIDGMSIPDNMANRHYRQMQQEITDGVAEILPFDQAAADAQAEQQAALAELRAIDIASIRGIREYIAGKPDAPQRLKDFENDAANERANAAVIYLKWLGLALLDLALLPLSYLIVPFFSIFTKADDTHETTGWLGRWLMTWDNKAAGDNGWITKRSPYPNVLTGWKGWWNRTKWLYRNPLYGYQKWAGIPYIPPYHMVVTGDTTISDKYKRPGSYFVKLYDQTGTELLGFEYYLIKPYTENKCIRIRLGWKIDTDKFERYGFATLVDTIQPFKQYGD